MSTSADTKSVPVPRDTSDEVTTISKPSLKLVVVKPYNQKWTVMELVKERTPPSWGPAFVDAEAELEEVSEILEEDEKVHGTFYPLRCHVFRAFELTPAPMVKVVIISQDPYPQIKSDGKPRAVGLAFSVSKDDSVPISLKNIYKELESKNPEFKTPSHGDLTCWAQQGVLLLNSSLTIRSGGGYGGEDTAGSHGSIWLGFIRKAMRYVSTLNPTCVAILWGNAAKAVAPLLGDKFVIIEGQHPSSRNISGGFFGGDYFNKCNEALVKQRKKPIDWRIPE